MAYPVIDVPMYEPLADLSAELFLPNINLIEPNSITLLETNQRFIEAYMVGLNHEFARELLWREYPTDQRGSYFRQFWDVAPAARCRPRRAEARTREAARHPAAAPLAAGLAARRPRPPRAARATNEEEVVLVIRGELLKRYPDAVIYAQRAEWQRRADGEALDPARGARARRRSSAAEEDSTRRATMVRTPLYEAKVDPDIYFFGFDLTGEEAQRRRQAAASPTDDPGWFFVIKERPGEPRFGLDIERDGALNVWNDLAWPDVLPDGASFVTVDDTATLELAEPTAPAVQEKHVQWVDDQATRWSPDMHASEVAYITYQAPVLVAVHAHEMLRG